MPLNLSQHDAATTATALVKAALESGAIKLAGNTGRAADNGTNDAIYLSTLLNELTNKIQAAN